MTENDYLTKKFLSVVYFFMGISANAKYQTYEKANLLFFYVISYPVAMAGCAYAFTQYREFEYKIEIALNILLYSLFAVVHTVVTWNKPKLVDFYDCIVSVKKALGEEFLKISDSFMAAAVKMVFSLLSSFAVIFVCALVAGSPYFTSVKLGHITTLFGTIIFPWTDSSVLGYILTIVIQLIVITQPTTMYIGCFSLALYIQALVASLLNWIVEQIETSFSAPYSRVDEQLAISQLHRIIHYHQIIVGICDKISWILVPIVNYSTLLFFFSGVFCTMIIFEAAGNDTIHLLKILLTELMSIGILIVLCEIGSLLEEMNNRIHDALYHSYWYSRSRRFRLDLLSYMRQLQKPILLKGFRSKVLNRAFMKNTFNFTYSALQVLIKTKNKYG